MLNDFTLVLGVDRTHLNQLELVLPTWRKHKPSLFERPLLIFFDHEQLEPAEIARVTGGRGTAIPWPPRGVTYEEGDGWKESAQRYKMLSGFVHVPAQYVNTPYWLKIDTDTIAWGQDDWVPALSSNTIIAQKWHFTKPAEQMLKLDEWAARHDDLLGSTFAAAPLDLQPLPGWSRLSHPRIISWCGFFNTCFTQHASAVAADTCGEGHLPVRSQDGYLWYMAKRWGLEVQRTDFKSRGWKHRHTARGIREAVNEAMGYGTVIG